MGFLDRRVVARQRRREQTIALAIRRRARVARGEERERLQALLDDDEAMEMAVLSVLEQAPDDEDDSGDGPLIRLLNWVRDNWDWIYSVIQVVIGLFSGVGGVGGATFFSLPKEEPAEGRGRE
jgi:hypothetical protein